MMATDSSADEPDTRVDTSNHTREPECDRCMQPDPYNTDCIKGMDCDECLIIRGNEGGVCHPYGSPFHGPGICESGRCTGATLDMGSDCTCSTVDDCCDGCNPIDAGTACDDGLDCTLDTTCQDDGTCGGSTGSPCNAQLEHPDCQAAMCDEVAGCSTAPTREGLECSTPGPGTFDGICQAGVCVGQQSCECSTDDGPCCDGCHIQPAGTECGTSESNGVSCNIGECGGEWTITQTKYRCDGQSVECPTNNGQQITIDSGTCMADQSCRSASAMPCVPDPSCP